MHLPVYHLPFDISVCKFKKKEMCGEANNDAAKEFNYMANHNRQGFHTGGFSGYQQGGNFNNNQGEGWRSHSGNQFNKEQGGFSNRPPNQGPNLYDQTTKLEDTLT